jgi:HME family heavy-metal exporter
LLSGVGGLDLLILYSRYRSCTGRHHHGNIPLALVGAVVGCRLSGQPLSVATWSNFVRWRTLRFTQRH